MRDLVLFALKEEAPTFFKKYENVFAIGVGKVNSAISTLDLIHTYKPNRIINLGTGGGVDVNNGIHRINRVFQHDVNLVPLGLEPSQMLKDDLSFIIINGTGKTCASGDLFVTESHKLRTKCDIVDMEAYSIAKVAMKTNVDVEIWKYISDNADEEAKNNWQDRVSMGEKLYSEVLTQLNVDLIDKQ